MPTPRHTLSPATQAYTAGLAATPTMTPEV